MTDLELLALAREAAANSYSPYSHFAVGAALECSDGTVFTGCNIENAAYGRDFARIAIWADSREYCYPCGSCRQFLQEFNKEMTVICGRGDGSFVSHPLREMMPFTFDF